MSTATTRWRLVYEDKRGRLVLSTYPSWEAGTRGLDDYLVRWGNVNASADQSVGGCAALSIAFDRGRKQRPRPKIVCARPSDLVSLTLEPGGFKDA